MADARRAKVVGNYVLGAQLGRGSFAVVWQAQHRVTGATVAVKEINTLQLNAKLKQSLECEISILQRVEHRNIVRLRETLELPERNRMYLIMEFCAGGDLAHYIRRRKRVTEATAHGLMLQLAAGLNEMWSHNLVHRDLKPQNLLLSNNSPIAVLKIADFGFARDLQPQGLAETLCGSPLYMAPEILRFQKYDAKADLWSVGTILFELLSGRPPFHGDNHVQLLRNIEQQAPRIPVDLNLSANCRRLLAGLLKRNPVERISFEEFFAHPWLAAAAAPAASPGAPDTALEPSAGSGISQHTTPTERPAKYAAGGSGLSTSTGPAADPLPFMVEGEEGGGSTDASRALPVSSCGRSGAAPLLMSSAHPDTLMGPLTPSTNDTGLAHMAISSRGSCTGAAAAGRRQTTAPTATGGSAGGDAMDEDDYVIIDGGAIGVRAAAALAQQHSTSPSGLAVLGRRGFAAIWHPLSQSPAATPQSPCVSHRPPPSPRSAAGGTQHQQYQQQQLQQHQRPAAGLRWPPSMEAHSQRRTSLESAASSPATSPTPGTAGVSADCAIAGLGGCASVFGGSALFGPMAAAAAAAGADLEPYPQSYAEALEQAAGGLESMAAHSTRQDQPSKGLALRLLALQLLQLALDAERHPPQHPQQQTVGDSAAAVQTSQALACATSIQVAACDAPTGSTAGASSLLATRTASSSGLTTASPAAASSPMAPRLTAALHAVSGAAQRNATALAQSGCAAGANGCDLPDAWETAYEGGIALSRAAAAEELLSNWAAAAHAYAKAAAVMRFIAGEACRLPLQPAPGLTPPQLGRVERYAAAITARLAAVSRHLEPQQQEHATGDASGGGGSR